MSGDILPVRIACPRAGGAGAFADTPARRMGDPDHRVRRPDMLMIGATGRNAGKTELACRLIRQHAAQVPIAALKVTTVVHTDGTCPRGGAGCGVCASLDGSWHVTRELDAGSDKDTSRLLTSGAREAYWLRVRREALREGAAGLLAHVPAGWVSVCESNSLGSVVEPGLFLQVRGASERGGKASARDVADFVDTVVTSDGISFDLPLDRISVMDRQWVLRREACAFVATPPVPALMTSLRAQFSQVEAVDIPFGSEDDDRRWLKALAVALARSRHEWCLLVWDRTDTVAPSVVNEMFRRRHGVTAVFAGGATRGAGDQLALVHRDLLPAVVAGVA